MKNTHPYLLAAFLAVIGVSIFVYKYAGLGLPLTPEESSQTWQLETRIAFRAGMGPIKVSLQFPSLPGRYAVIDQNFVAPGYGLFTQANGANRQSVFATRDALGEQVLYASFTVHRVPRATELIPMEESPPEDVVQLVGAKQLAARTVLDIARSLGYPGPNPMARKLRTGRAGAIGVVFGDSLSYAFSDTAAVTFLQGVGEACQQAGHGLLIVPANGGGTSAVVRDAIVDGFIVYATYEQNPLVVEVQQRNLPLVTVDSSQVDDFPAIRIDDHGGARQAAQHLLALGHRRLAIIVPRLGPQPHEGPVDAARRADITYPVCADRIAGYHAAMAAAGVDPDAAPIEERHTNGEQAGYDAALQLLGRTPRPTGILAMTDRLAIGALRAAAAMGLRVPDDLSVVGFDDIDAAAQAQPPLTTVHQPVAEKGSRAVAALLGAAPPAPLPTRLVMRASTAPPPEDMAHT